jgi:competence protein ComEA
MNKWLLAVALISSPVFAIPVNVNRADAKIIAASLTGIGIKKAEAIVAERANNGDFKSIDDLKRVIGIGEKTLAVNRADILLDDHKTVAVNITIPIAITSATPAPVKNTSARTSEKPDNPASWTTQIGWLAVILIIVSLLTVVIRKYYSAQQPKIK